MSDITESVIHISRGILIASYIPHHDVSLTREYMKYSPRKDQNWNGYFFTNVCVSCGKVERWVVSEEKQSALKNFPTGPTNTRVWWIYCLSEMGNTQHFRLLNNVDRHARSAKYHLSCNCDCVVRYNNIQRANANIVGNGDHINSAVALTKTYKSVNLELTVVN